MNAKKYTLDDLMTILDDEAMSAVRDVLEEYARPENGGDVEYEAIYDVQQLIAKAVNRLSPVWHDRYQKGA